MLDADQIVVDTRDRPDGQLWIGRVLERSDPDLYRVKGLKGLVSFEWSVYGRYLRGAANDEAMNFKVAEANAASAHRAQLGV